MTSVLSASAVAALSLTLVMAPWQSHAIRDRSASHQDLSGNARSPRTPYLALAGTWTLVGGIYKREALHMTWPRPISLQFTAADLNVNDGTNNEVLHIVSHSDNEFSAIFESTTYVGSAYTPDRQAVLDLLDSLGSAETLKPGRDLFTLKNGILTIQTTAGQLRLVRTAH